MSAALAYALLNSPSIRDGRVVSIVPSPDRTRAIVFAIEGGGGPVASYRYRTLFVEYIDCDLTPAGLAKSKPVVRGLFMPCIEAVWANDDEVVLSYDRYNNFQVRTDRFLNEAEVQATTGQKKSFEEHVWVSAVLNEAMSEQRCFDWNGHPEADPIKL
ncbi:hypothetical protein [Parvularcula dongshanensis]|uniref:Uncharacterized protein n=1 Tax=Parvularcula dongshanensis TaxID=1173995 RepID=A0A840I0S5_9PROT|nr:hypothetical protein [Parvularcula dongshanensis]MBB4658327.1 hypothetical protein [Parvularcula dongshanensis]